MFAQVLQGDYYQSRRLETTLNGRPRATTANQPSGKATSPEEDEERNLFMVKPVRSLPRDVESTTRDRVLLFMRVVNVLASWYGYVMALFLLKTNSESIALQISISISTAISCCCILACYVVYLISAVIHGTPGTVFVPKTPLKTRLYYAMSMKGQLLKCIVEIIIHIPHPIPHHYDTTGGLVIWMYMRVYLVLFVVRFSHNAFRKRFDYFVTTEEGKTLVRKYDVSVDNGFCFKMVMWKDEKLSAILVVCLTLFPLAGLMLVFENNERSGNNFTEALWWTFTSPYTTVGFGDSYPSTFASRGVTAIIVLVGVFTLNLISAGMVSGLKLNQSDNCAMEYYSKMSSTRAYKKASVELLKAWLLVGVLKKRFTKCGNEENYIRLSQASKNLLKAQEKVKFAKTAHNQDSLQVTSHTERFYKRVFDFHKTSLKLATTVISSASTTKTVESTKERMLKLREALYAGSFQATVSYLDFTAKVRKYFASGKNIFPYEVEEALRTSKEKFSPASKFSSKEEDSLEKLYSPSVFSSLEAQVEKQQKALVTVDAPPKFESKLAGTREQLMSHLQQKSSNEALELVEALKKYTDRSTAARIDKIKREHVLHIQILHEKITELMKISTSMNNKLSSAADFANQMRESSGECLHDLHNETSTRIQQFESELQILEQKCGHCFSTHSKVKDDIQSSYAASNAAIIIGQAAEISNKSTVESQEQLAELHARFTEAKQIAQHTKTITTQILQQCMDTSLRFRSQKAISRSINTMSDPVVPSKKK